MIFSVEFVLAFLLFMLCYNALSRAWQNLALLCFNLAFVYFCNSYFLAVLLIYTLFVHFCALEIHARGTRAIYSLSLAGCVAYLCAFKYFSDFKSAAFALLERLGFAADFELVFALGLSFYCFASITYLAQIYHRRAAPAPFLRLLAYLSFFATFVAGPIFRYEHFERAWLRRKRFMHRRLTLALILVALAKKLAIAPLVFSLLDAPLQSAAPSLLALLSSALLYSFYLYADFSAYSELAMALAFALGLRIPRNFAYPLAAAHIGEFWRRWHMSLSSFIRDFIYIPLGGSRRGAARYILATLAAFVLSGIWHGTGSNFALWGLAHGLLLIAYRFYSAVVPWRLPRFFAALVCFLFTSLCWLLFFMPISELAALWALPHGAASDYEWQIFGAILSIWALGYFTRGARYALARALGHPLAAAALSLAWMYAVLAAMPAGVPNFIYASF